MGCVEEQRSGRVHQWTSGGFTQWPICIDMALHGGVLNSYGDRVWLDSGDTSSFKTYEDVVAAVLYAGPGTIFAGLGTYADSMAAVKYLVYDRKNTPSPS